MANGSKNQMLYGAALITVGVVIGSVLVSSALDRMTAQVNRATGRLDKIERAVADAKSALGNLGQGRAAPTRQARGPDPDKRYSFKLAGSPAKGPETAKVTIVEFSDFQ